MPFFLWGTTCIQSMKIKPLFQLKDKKKSKLTWCCLSGRHTILLIKPQNYWWNTNGKLLESDKCSWNPEQSRRSTRKGCLLQLKFSSFPSFFHPFPQLLPLKVYSLWGKRKWLSRRKWIWLKGLVVICSVLIFAIIVKGMCSFFYHIIVCLVGWQTPCEKMLLFQLKWG